MIIENLIVAGRTVRDPTAVQHHVADLAVISVPTPSTVRLLCRVAADLLTGTDVAPNLYPARARLRA